MTNNFERTIENAFHDLGHNDANMDRGRPYNGQPWTDAGIRGATEIKGITFRDLRDCFIRAVLLSAHHLVPHLYAEADKGEKAALSQADLFGFDLDKVDPVAISQNLGREIERIMGIYPNIPEAESAAALEEMGLRSPGAKIGHENREAVRQFFAAHIGCSNVECAKALGLSAIAVGRHVATLRKEWEGC